jgi:hypothetical protein
MTIRVPVLSHLIGLGTTYADKANLPVFNVVFCSPTGERFAVCAIGWQTPSFAHWDANGDNCLYLRDRIVHAQWIRGFKRF